jgi:nucleoside-triphosphatase THEP1
MFKKATKKQSKLRLALYGASGSGKTYTALEIAAGLGGKIAAIDSENGTISKYADRFNFDVVELNNKKNIQEYTKYINEAEQAGYDVLIIDSLSHAWYALLEEVDKRKANTKFDFGVWAWATPIQREFIEAVLKSKLHIIATMRSKMDYIIENENGKSKPKRIGMAPVQGKDIEYEFDMLIEMTNEHSAVVMKDRTGKYQDAIIDKPNKKLGQELYEWLQDGKKPAVDVVRDIAHLLKNNGYDFQKMGEMKAVLWDEFNLTLHEDNAGVIHAHLKEQLEAKNETVSNT